MDKKLTVISYDPHIIESYSSDSLDDVLTQVRDDRISWVIVRGYGTSGRGDIQRLLSAFAADPALSEKILNQVRLEFSDRLPDCLYFEYSTPIPIFDTERNEYTIACGCVVLGERFLLLFDESMLGVFDDIQQKILSGHTRAQGFGSDYLFYLLFRAAISHIEQLLFVELVKRFDEIEDEVLANPGRRCIFDELMAARELVKPLYDPLRRLLLSWCQSVEKTYVSLPKIPNTSLPRIWQPMLKRFGRGFCACATGRKTCLTSIAPRLVKEPAASSTS
jgi:hypothetical protein